MKLTIPTKKIILILIIISAVTVALSLSGQYYKYFFNDGNDRYITTFINLDSEGNIPTWVNALYLLFCSLLLLIISLVKGKSHDSFFAHWLFLSFLFLLLATDETIQLHEQIISPIRNTFNTEGYLYYAWVIPAFIFVLLLLLAYLKFLIKLEANSRRLFIISGFIYVFGSMVFEIIGGKYVSDFGQNNFTYSLITTVEETFELAGLIIFIYALLKYLGSKFPDLRISFH